MKLNKLLNKSTLAMAVSSVAFSAGAAQLEEIIVTAQKREQILQDVPISLDVLGKEELSVKAISTTQDLALASPSLTFLEGSNPAGSNFAVRGIGSLAFEGGIQPSVSFVVDGIPLGRVSEFQADLGDIERVEVLNGPQGTLYGRNATGGAVNIVRAKPSEDFEAYVEQTLTDDDESITRVMANGALTDSTSGRISAFYKDRDGHIENLLPGGEDGGGEETWAVMGKLNIDINDQVNLLLTGEVQHARAYMGTQILLEPEAGGLGLARLATLGSLGAPSPDFAESLARGQRIVKDPFKGAWDTHTVTDSDNSGFTADLTWELSDDVTLKSLTGIRRQTQDTEQDVDVTPAGPRPGGVYNPFSLPVVYLGTTSVGSSSGDNYVVYRNQDTFTQELRLEGSNDSMDWTGGFFYSNFEEASRATIAVLAFDPAVPFPPGTLISADPRVGKAEFDSYAAFGDVTFHISQSFDIFAGLRWTVEDLEVSNNRRKYSAFTGLGGYVINDVNDVEIFDQHQIAIPIGGNLVNLPTQASFDPDGDSNGADYVVKDRSEDWSGRIGATWYLSDDVNLYASAARGYVGSGANYSRSGTVETAVLEPSISEAYELGIKSQLFDNSVNLNAALFWQEVTDLQSSALIPGTIQTTTFNAGNLTTSGLELSATWAATDMLTLDANATWLDTEIDDLVQACYSGQTAAQGCTLDADGNMLPGGAKGTQQDVSGNTMVLAPDLSYNLSARLDFPLDSMPFTAYAMVVYSYNDGYQFELKYDPMLAQDQFELMDLYLGIEDKEGRYSVSLFGKNLGDEYFDNAKSEAFGSQGRVLGRPARGAQTYFGLKAKYNFF